MFVHPFDDPVVIEGHSSLGREILEDAPETEVIVVPAGGGGLVAGVATGASGVRVIAVEPEGSCALHQGLAAGQPVQVETSSIADALNAPTAGVHTDRQPSPSASTGSSSDGQGSRSKAAGMPGPDRVEMATVQRPVEPTPTRRDRWDLNHDHQ